MSYILIAIPTSPKACANRGCSPSKDFCPALPSLIASVWGTPGRIRPRGCIGVYITPRESLSSHASKPNTASSGACCPWMNIVSYIQLPAKGGNDHLLSQFNRNISSTSRVHQQLKLCSLKVSLTEKDRISQGNESQAPEKSLKTEDHLSSHSCTESAVIQRPSQIKSGSFRLFYIL